MKYYSQPSGGENQVIQSLIQQNETHHHTERNLNGNIMGESIIATQTPRAGRICAEICVGSQQMDVKQILLTYDRNEWTSRIIIVSRSSKIIATHLLYINHSSFPLPQQTRAIWVSQAPDVRLKTQAQSNRLPPGLVQKLTFLRWSGGDTVTHICQSFQC